MTLSEAFASYCLEEIKLQGKAEKTAKNYVCSIRSFLKSSADIPVELLTYQHVVQWKLAMDRQGMAASTISSNLSKLREVLKYCAKHHMNVLDYRDVELPKVAVHEPDFLDYTEVTDMIDCAIRPRDKALLATLWSTGARISEVLSLDRDTIQGNQAIVLGKGSKYLTLYIDKHAKHYIDEYLGERSDRIPALFISSQRRRLTVQRAEQIVAQISGELGITKRVTPHTFRHSYASDLLKNGSDLKTVQDLLHHNSINTTMRYLHTSDKRKAENYGRFHSV